MIERRTKLEVFGAKESKPTVAIEFFEVNNLHREDETKEEAEEITEQEAIFNALACWLLLLARNRRLFLFRILFVCVYILSSWTNLITVPNL